MDFDQLFQAKRGLVDQLDVPHRLAQRACGGVVFTGAKLAQPAIETLPKLAVGARHRVLHELDAGQIAREFLRGGATSGQQTHETEKPHRAPGVHCSMNRPVLKS